MRGTMKFRILCGSLTVAAVAAVTPAAIGWAGGTDATAKAGPAVCQAIAGDLQSTVGGLQQSLIAVPPALDAVPKTVNGLLETVTSLVDLGCLPVPALPVAAPVQQKASVQQKAEGRQEAQTAALPGVPGIPLPTPSLGVPGLPGVLPTVPVCTDLTADLLAAVTDLLAALLSTNLPDLTGAVDAAGGLLDTLTKLADPAAACLPAEVPVV